MLLFPPFAFVLRYFTSKAEYVEQIGGTTDKAHIVLSLSAITHALHSICLTKLKKSGIKS